MTHPYWDTVPELNASFLRWYFAAPARERSCFCTPHSAVAEAVAAKGRLDALAKELDLQMECWDCFGIDTQGHDRCYALGTAHTSATYVPEEQPGFVQDYVGHHVQMLNDDRDAALVLEWLLDPNAVPDLLAAGFPGFFLGRMEVEWSMDDPQRLDALLERGWRPNRACPEPAGDGTPPCRAAGHCQAPLERCRLCGLHECPRHDDPHAYAECITFDWQEVFERALACVQRGYRGPWNPRLWNPGHPFRGAPVEASRPLPSRETVQALLRGIEFDVAQAWAHDEAMLDRLRGAIDKDEEPDYAGAA